MASYDNTTATCGGTISARDLTADVGHLEYVLMDPTHTDRWQYHEDDLEDCFWDTGLRNEEVKPIMDERIREIFQRVHEHLFRTVHDSEMGEPDGEKCITCRKRRGE